MTTKRRQIEQSNMFEVKFIVTLDEAEKLESDWMETTDADFEAVCQKLERFRLLEHFAVAKDGVDIFINPNKIKYVTVVTRDPGEDDGT